MMTDEDTLSRLHFAVMNHIVIHGKGPTEADLSVALNVGKDEAGRRQLSQALLDLENYHGVVLHPKQRAESVPRIWVMHPFSLAPTNFVVRANDREWWGNCAWCSFGVAALLQPHDVTISTTDGADRESVTLRITNGELDAASRASVVHFPVPMTEAWDNVVYTCSVMLLFKDEVDVSRWSRLHGIEKGDVQPAEKVWEFAKVWYGQHLSPKWRKWTLVEAANIFGRFGLTHPVWHIPTTREHRF